VRPALLEDRLPTLLLGGVELHELDQRLRMPHLRPPRRQLPVVTGYGVDNIKRGLVDLRVPGDIQTDVGGAGQFVTSAVPALE
jgi:hypothetical protein